MFLLVLLPCFKLLPVQSLYKIKISEISSSKEECVTYNKTRELKVEENCFDTYEESEYLEQCNFYIEVR